MPASTNTKFIDKQIGQIPILDSLLLKNPLRLWASKVGLITSNSPVVNFARTRIAARADVELGSEKETLATQGAKGGRKDFLSRFYEAHHKDPEFISRERVLSLTVANMFAGSDTTAISLRAIFYNLLKTPTAMESLMQELGQQQETGLFSHQERDGLVDWNEVRELPYLSAVIKEALRVHPAVGLTLERVVPARGITICGQAIPAGTIVGCNAWTVHLNSLFGENPEQFRPRRWIDASKEQKRNMENSLFSFGAGARTCIGKNISLLEMYKLVPAVLMRFDVNIFSPPFPSPRFDYSFADPDLAFLYFRLNWPTRRKNGPSTTLGSSSRATLMCG